MEKTVLGQEEAAEIQDDDDSDDGEPIAEEVGRDGLGDAQAGGQKLTFAIDSQIDINSRALLDMISEEAVVVDHSARTKTASNQGEMSVDEAFDDW